MWCVISIISSHLLNNQPKLLSKKTTNRKRGGCKTYLRTSLIAQLLICFYASKVHLNFEVTPHLSLVPILELVLLNSSFLSTKKNCFVPLFSLTENCSFLSFNGKCMNFYSFGVSQLSLSCHILNNSYNRTSVCGLH